MQRIVKISKSLKHFSLFLLFFLPLFNLIFWSSDGLPILREYGYTPFIEFARAPSIAALSLGQKIAGFFVTMIPIGFIMLILFWIYRLFKRYEKLEIFSSGCVKDFRNFALTLLLSQFAYPIYVSLYSITLTINNPPGERFISAVFDTEQIILIAIAYAIFLISWVMDEGRKLKEEVEATI